MGRPHMAQVQALFAQLEHGIGIEPAVGGHQTGVFVDPGEEFFPARHQPSLSSFGVEVLVPLVARNDGGAQALKDLQAVDVVGVVVRDDHIAHGLRRHLANAGQKFLRQRRRPQCVDDHHPCRGDDETGVRNVISVGRRAQRSLALDVPGTPGDMLCLHCLGRPSHGCRQCHGNEDQPAKGRCSEAARGPQAQQGHGMP